MYVKHIILGGKIGSLVDGGVAMVNSSWDNIASIMVVKLVEDKNG